MTTFSPQFFSLLLVFVLAVSTSGSAFAQEMTPEEIANTLKPKKLTRTLKKDENAVALDEVLSRSIGVIERQKIVEITEKAELPRLDFTIGFGFDSSDIERSSYSTLDALATALKSDVLYKSRFLVNGHTDAKGAEDYNLDLSQRRANAVVSYLTSQHQIEEGRLKPIGFGESKLKDESDGEGSANRRVEIISRP